MSRRSDALRLAPWALAPVILALWFTPAIVQVSGTTNNDPRVTITETVPPDHGTYIVKGFLARDVTLTCFVENLDKTLTVKWQRTTSRGDIIPIATDMDIQDNNKWSIEKPTAFSWRLRIKALQIEDEGNYTCFVQVTSVARVEANRTVLATDPPAIMESMMSSDSTVKEGDFLQLMCNATGRPKPTLIWRREGNAILPDGGVVKLGGKLEISSAQYRNRGTYMCQAVNEVGQVMRKIFLNVQFSPKVGNNGDVSQAIGYQRTLICYIDSNPAPKRDNMNNLYWTRDNKYVQQSDRLIYRVLEGAHSRLILELIIKRVREEDFGSYTCNARNTMGSGQASISLTKSDTPMADKGGLISAASMPQSHVLSGFLIFLIATIFLQT